MRLPKLQQRQYANVPDFPIIVIGGSTGAPRILEQIIDGIREDQDAAILIVQHMPGRFTASMAERLNRGSERYIKEIEDHEEVRPGTIYIAPGDSHVHVESGPLRSIRFRLSQEEGPLHISPSIDIAMESASEVFGPRTLGVLLSGMGQDGAKGMQRIRINGGETIVQEPSTCVIDSMVQMAIGCDGAGLILSPDRIPPIIEAIVHSI